MSMMGIVDRIREAIGKRGLEPILNFVLICAYILIEMEKQFAFIHTQNSFYRIVFLIIPTKLLQPLSQGPPYL